MKDKTNLKTASIKAAITPKMEQEIFNYCARHNVSVSKLMREAIQLFLDRENLDTENFPLFKERTF